MSEDEREAFCGEHDGTDVERQRMGLAEEMAACLFDTMERLDPDSVDDDGTFAGLSHVHQMFFIQVSLSLLDRVELLQRAATFSHDYHIGRRTVTTE